MTTDRPRRTLRILKVLLGCAALALLTACKNVGPMDALNPEGPIARDQHRLFVPVFWIAAVVFVLVEGLVVVACLKFRDRPGGPSPVQVHGNTKMEIGWTLAPAVLLAAISVPTVAMIFSQAAEPKGPEVVRIKVIGHQWWWEYQYDTEPMVKTANEMVIPTGRKVFLQVTSTDVIHSFWVPKLGGKQDAVPNRLTPMTLIAEKADTYYGQCAEFCALSHANMKLRVVSKSPADYERWLAGQKRKAVIPATGPAAEGASVFEKFASQSGSCIGCHTLRGIPGAEGTIGPDLTHFASRETFAGAILEMNAKDLEAWLRDPPALKPGSLMPNYHIPQEAIRALVAFLLTLE